LIASLSVSGADYQTSSPTKWDFKSERECPALNSANMRPDGFIK